MPPSVVGLFSGCGGFDLGFIQAGFHCVGAFDLDAQAVLVHRSNTGAPVERKDLSDGMPPTGLPDEIDVVIAGPPCQGFSTIGARRLDDPRNELLLSAGRIARHLQPKVFIAENVAGATSGEHGRFWTELGTMLRDSGYRTAEILVDCSEHGVAQRRRRALLAAWRVDREVRFELSRSPRLTLGDALAGMQGALNHDPAPLASGSVGARIAARVKPGQKLCNVRGGETSIPTWDVPEVYGTVTLRQRELLCALRTERRRHRVRNFGDADPVSSDVLATSLGRPIDDELMALVQMGYIRAVGGKYDLTHTFNGKYKRLRWDSPSATVDTKFGDPRFFLHPDEDRGFTVREAARIQGFPDWFTFQGTVRQQYTQVGNAVPPPLATKVAEWVQRALLS